jgi:hypothetical protein
MPLDLRQGQSEAWESVIWSRCRIEPGPIIRLQTPVARPLCCVSLRGSYLVPATAR